jgi:hypothetical protein
LSSGTYSSIVNHVYDTIKAACVKGGTLEYVKNCLLGAHHDLTQLSGRLPVIIVHKASPSRTESWGLVANTERRANVSLLID